MYGHPDIYSSPSASSFGLSHDPDYEDILLGVDIDDFDDDDEFGFDEEYGINLFAKARAKGKKKTIERILGKLTKFVQRDDVGKVDKYASKLKRKFDKLEKIADKTKKESRKAEIEGYIDDLMDNPDLQAFLDYADNKDYDQLRVALGIEEPDSGDFDMGPGPDMGAPQGPGMAMPGPGMAPDPWGTPSYGPAPMGPMSPMTPGVAGTLSPSGAFVPTTIRRSEWEDQYLTPAGGYMAAPAPIQPYAPTPSFSPGPYMGPTPGQAYRRAFRAAKARQMGRAAARAQARSARQAARVARGPRPLIPRPFRRPPVRRPPVARPIGVRPPIRGPIPRPLPRPIGARPPIRRLPSSPLRSPVRRTAAVRRMAPKYKAAGFKRPRVAARRAIRRGRYGAVDPDIARWELFGADPYITSEALGRANTFSRSQLFDSVEAETALDEDDLFDIMEENAEFGAGLEREAAYQSVPTSYGALFQRNLGKQIEKMRRQWARAKANGDLTKMHQLEGRIAEAEGRYEVAQEQVLDPTGAKASAFERSYKKAAREVARKERKAARAAGRAAVYPGEAQRSGRGVARMAPVVEEGPPEGWVPRSARPAAATVPARPMPPGLSDDDIMDLPDSLEDISWLDAPAADFRERSLSRGFARHIG
jgi:hypothetical protein